MSIQKLFPFALIPLVFAVISCTMKTELKQQTANHIARPAFMVERNIATGPFALKAWERMHKPMDVATIYIEGDGILPRTRGHFTNLLGSNSWGGANTAPDTQTTRTANSAIYDDTQANWNSNTTTSNSDGVSPFIRPDNPTPMNPVALHLASRDKSDNLAYLARPCQFMKNPQGKGCARTYWEENRFAPEVIEAYNTALDNIANLYDITGFHLVGYDGGANIAAVLAAKRADVLSLRTVAGNLNPGHESSNLIHRPLASNAVLASNHAQDLVLVPQHHFIGAADEYIQPGVYHSFRQMLGLSECVHYSLVTDADHTRGWVEKWPELLTHTPQCNITTPDLPAAEPIIGPIPGAIPYIPNRDQGYKGYDKS